MDLAECERLVEEAILLFEGLYVHLPLKRAMYAVDPVRRLRLLSLKVKRFHELKRRLEEGGRMLSGEQAPPRDDMWFHREMSDAFTSVRDLHTMYLLPPPFDRAVAFVPFQIEDYFKDGERRYTVSNVVDGLGWFEAPQDFVRGAEITYWNGIPIPRAVELAGARNPGGNSEARMARGLARLTVRPLAKVPPPDEEFVIVHYASEGGRNGGGFAVPWYVAALGEGEEGPRDGAPLDQAMDEGLDHETDLIRVVRKETYASPREPGQEKWSLRGGGKARDRQGDGIERVEDIESALSEILQAKRFSRGGRQYGYMRLRSFKVEDGELLDEFVRLLEQMPGEGLIIDVRDNPGGRMRAGERLLQTLTPKEITPEPLQFINSELNLRLCRLFPEYSDWAESIARAAETGATFSSSLPPGSSLFYNDRGQRYYGPVVLIANALCYSTTDIFVAGFQDHEIGKVIGTDGSTGAGGANVVSHSDLRRKFEALRADAQKRGATPPEWPLGELPVADLRFAIRRSLRIGKHAGMELEDLGVIPDVRYEMTKEDVLNGNRKLIAEAVELLRGMDRYGLRETEPPKRGDASVTASVETLNIDRLDISIDGWASPSVQVQDGRREIEAGLPLGGEAVELQPRGYRQGRMVAGRKIGLAS